MTDRKPIATAIIEHRVAGVTLHLDKDTAERLGSLLHYAMSWSKNPWAMDVHDAIYGVIGEPTTAVDEEIEQEVRRHVVAEMSAHADEAIIIDSPDELLEDDTRPILIRRLDRAG